MSQEKSVVVRVQTLRGVWETLGADRARGVWPEDDQWAADHWGPSKASFDLHRDPGAMWPDIGAFTPVEAEIGGVPVWSGFVAETPTSQSSRVINVQCKGWQYHLDDDAYQRAYVHTKLSDYKDIRGVPGAVLGTTALNAAGQVTADGGQLYLGWASGTALVPGATVGVVVDLGPGSTAKRVYAAWEGSNNASDFLCICRGADVATNVDVTGNYDDAFSFALNTAASGATAGTLATARRFVKFYLYNSTFTGTLGADYFWKVTAVSAFADLAYQSSDASVLKAPVIIRDALDRGTILLSDDQSAIDPDATVTFNFPEFALDGQKTPREVISAANAVHDYVAKVDARRRFVFKPKPSAPLFEIGEWPGSSADDQSANAGEEIYSRVIVEGTAATGEKMTVERSASQADGVVGEPITSPAPDNPSFATDTANWTPSTGTTITRDTVTFDTTPASGKWDRAGNPTEVGDTLSTTFSGTFEAGITYILAARFGVSGPVQGVGATATFGSATDHVTADWGNPSAFVTRTIAWTPTITTVGVTLTFRVTARSTWYVDSLALTVAKPTLVDRRGFRRTHILPVKVSLTTELGTQVGDVWLDAHKTTPFKGTATITGDSAARHITTGAGVPPEQLLLHTGELLRLADRIDPDTGGQGRDGRIAEVTYSSADDTATVALDSRRTSHEALLERLAVVIGSG